MEEERIVRMKKGIEVVGFPTLCLMFGGELYGRLNIFPKASPEERPA